MCVFSRNGVMSSENFIISVLNNPTDTIAYSVSKRLVELYPERAVLEGEESSFDVLEFAQAGQCEIVDEPHVYNQTRIRWHGAERPLERATVNAWFNVLWEGRLIDVVYLTWHDEGYRTRFF